MADRQPDHNWEHRGISIPDNGYKYFSGVLLRYIASFLLGVVSASFFLGGKSRDVSELLRWQGEETARVDRMDHEGTSSSRTGIKIEENRLNVIEANQKNDEELARRVPVLEAQVNRMESDLRDLKNQRK